MSHSPISWRDLSTPDEVMALRTATAAAVAGQAPMPSRRSDVLSPFGRRQAVARGPTRCAA